MTDNELLELAAKAYGAQPDLVHTGCFYDQNTPDKRFWNPINDDGDALRLAVKLKLDVDHNQGKACVYGDGVTVEISDGDDPYKATRHAITLAAAEIQKRKESK